MTRCSCKHESFQLRIDYAIRADGDVDYIEVHSICSECAKTRRQIRFEVDYSGTDHLLTQPLVPCRNPRILYDLQQLNLLLTFPDMNRIVDHLASTTKYGFTARIREGNSWRNVLKDGAGVKQIIERTKYLCIYASPTAKKIPEQAFKTVKDEAAFWKRSEVIRISCPHYVCSHHFPGLPPGTCHCSDPPTHSAYEVLGISFDIAFANEFVRDERVVAKSSSFRAATASLMEMLKDQFVCWRSLHSFDNPDVNVRIFADRFRKKPISK